ncbi:GntR family transcriptional regulator [Rhizobium binxianense]
MNTMDRYQGIVRKTLHHEVVVDALRELILEGELEPMSRINEVELCERFGISRTPLREAIKLLAAEGLLVLLPNRGARVVALSETEIGEILQVVGALEGAAGELACERITDEELTAIEAATAEMVAAWKAGDYPGYFALNREIHDAIMAAARNSALQSTYRSLSGRVQRARFSAHKTDAQWARAIDDHNLMVMLLRRRDGAALAQLMRDHLKSKWPVISAAYSEAKPAARHARSSRSKAHE